MYEIEKNIPFPNVKRRGRSRSLPIYYMEVGDSFFNPVRYFTAHHSQGFKSKYPDRVFSSRKETKNGVDGIRIWRLK